MRDLPTLLLLTTSSRRSWSCHSGGGEERRPSSPDPRLCRREMGTMVTSLFLSCSEDGETSPVREDDGEEVTDPRPESEI